MNWDENTPLSPDNLNDLESRITAALADVSTGKDNIYNALVSKGIIPGTKAFADLVAAINSIAVIGDQSATLKITGAGKPSKIIPAGLTTGGTITAELDTTLAQYILNTQTIGGVQGTLVQGRQVASGTGSLTQVNAYTAQLVVTGLAFTPTEIYLRGSVRARYSDDVFYGSPSYNYMTVNYAIYNNTIVPQSQYSNLYTITNSSGTVNYNDVITITASVTFQANGFTVVFTQTSPSTRGLDQYGTQRWTAIE